MAGNPFKPTAGATPPVLVGRESLIQEFEDSLADGPGAPARLSLVTGNRGVGKTALLNAFRDKARAHGWQTIDETAEAGFIERIANQLVSKRRQITGVSLPGGLSVELSEARQALDFRTILTRELEKPFFRKGLLITLDETQAGSIEELRTLGTTMQHMIRENRDIALVMAGLPSVLPILHRDKVISFFRRATPMQLKDVSLELVADSFRQVFDSNKREVADEAIELMAEATRGYPYMIQLVGYQTWQQARDSAAITCEHAKEGAAAALRRLGNTVHGLELDGLSNVDRTFLLAMAQDSGASSVRDIAERLGKDSNYVGTYRARLIEAGVITQAGYGKVDFAIPYMREWLKGHESLSFL
ncbi:AAA family ATPase [Actinotignum schaalii]|uniref:AAA family ATPase n=1 Tax=Actinotignum schaalii TaxID=59505 RepID=UPI000586DFEC|nr:ATP-binding protein [Actinotignum schaalii]